MKNFFIKQDDESDCGACALFWIIKYYDGYVPLEIIKHDTYTTKEGTTFLNIKNAATKYGFAVIGKNTYTFNDIQNPFIAQIKINDYLYHFIVVYKIHNNYVYIMDPAKGYCKFSSEEFNKIFTGNILMFEKITSLPKYRKNKEFILLLKNILKQNLLSIIFILMLCVILVLIPLANIYFIKKIISNYHYKLFILFIIILSFNCLLNYIKNYLVTHLNKKFNINLLVKYIKKYFSIPFKYLQLKNSGDIISRISDLNSIKDFFTRELINIIIYFQVFIFSSFIIYFSNSKISLYLFALTSIYILINYFLNKKIYLFYLKCIDSENLEFDYLIECITKIKTIKILNKDSYFQSKITSLINDNYQNIYGLQKRLNVIELLKDIYYTLSIIIIIYIGIDTMTLDNILIFIMYHDFYLNSVNYYISLMPNLIYFKSVLHQINSVYYIRDENPYKGTKTKYKSINITNLSYCININKVFNNFNLTINPKDKILLIGDNESGKSTLLNILYKNIDNYEGTIKIDNVNIKDISLNNLKNNISYIRQDEVLFNDTIKNNIILDQEFNELKFNKIADMLDLNKIIKNKSLGYNTLVKDNISGGERQRIILARGLYRDFEILFIDEALSEVSHYLRMKIINNINNFYKEKIIIYVSHMYEKYPFNKIINLTARKEDKC